MTVHSLYDLICVDCRTPVMDGCQAAGGIRKCEGAGRHTPIVALTAGTMVEDRERGARAGMDGCVGKPAGSMAIGAALARWVGETGGGIQY
jgi:CheY-like chemotaxis protein